MTFYQVGYVAEGHLEGLAASIYPRTGTAQLRVGQDTQGGSMFLAEREPLRE